MPRWDFERRRQGWLYENLAAVAYVVQEYVSREGNRYQRANHIPFRRALQDATGYEWPPDSEGYKDVFRNYKRLFKSFGIATVENGVLTLLPMGRWIVTHAPTSDEYYARIVATFCYPNAAFESETVWRSSGRVLSPFMLIIRCLRALADEGSAYLTPLEVLHCLYEAHDGLQSDLLAEAVLSFRHGQPPPISLPRTPQNVTNNPDDLRQVREIIAYLADAARLITYSGNLRSRKPVRLTSEGTDLGVFEPDQTTPVGTTVRPERLEYIEGQLFEEQRQSRRRNPSLRPAALEHYGYKCAVCNRSFDPLGEFSSRPLDVHHFVPLQHTPNARATTIDDVVIVCATCHRLIHAKDPPLTVAEAQSLLSLLDQE